MTHEQDVRTALGCVSVILTFAVFFTNALFKFGLKNEFNYSRRDADIRELRRQLYRTDRRNNAEELVALHDRARNLAWICSLERQRKALADIFEEIEEQLYALRRYDLMA